MNKNSTLVLVMFLLFLTVLHCSEPENWYQNADQAKAVLAPLSLHDGDSVPIFGKDSIGVKVYLREHLTSFTVSTPRNRFWKDTTIHSASFSNTPPVFHLSFYDTGWQEITLVSHRVNGDTITEHYRMYAVSPLRQTTLEIIPGDSVILSTPPVRERVLYFWDLHFEKVWHYEPEVHHLFNKTPSSKTGEVYVVDFDRREIRSPSSLFTINVKTSISASPQLVIENPLPLNDTVFSSTSVLEIAGNITGARSLVNVTINGVSVGLVKTDGNYHFVYEFKNIDSLQFLPVYVNICDTLDSFSSDTLFIKYKPSITVTQPVIVLQNPATDSSIADNQSVFIYGKVSNSDKYPSGAITSTKNDNVIPGFTRLSNGFFGFPVELELGINRLVLKFIEDTLSRNVLTNKRIIVQSDHSVFDKTGPAITVMYKGNLLVDSMVFERADPTLTILLLDNSSISSVMINGNQALLSPDSINALPTYTSTLLLAHPDNIITIQATDGNNNRSVIQYSLLRYNRLPVISGVFLDRGVAGKLFVWEPTVTDPDNDPLTVTAFIKGKIILMSSDGTIEWKSGPDDTGLQTVLIEAYDSYGISDTTFHLYVLKPSDAGIAVKWLDTYIPATLKEGDDTLNVTLRANPLSNMTPFRYKVESQLSDAFKVLHNSGDSTFVWAPDSSQVGIHTLLFTITDNAGNSDIFTRTVTVLNAIPAVVEFSNASSGGNENSTEASISVVLSKPLQTPVTVEYAIDSTATTASLSGDFTLPSVTTLTFEPGEVSKDIPLEIFNNSIPEQDRKIVLKLMTFPLNVVPGSQTTTTYTIFDDDFANYTFVTSLGSSGGGYWSTRVDSVFIEVAISRSFPKPVTLSCNIASEYTTAESTEYTLPASSQLLTIPAGTTKDTVILFIASNRMPTGYQPSYRKNVVALKLSATDPSLREGNITLYKYTIGEETAFYIDSTSLSVNEDDSIKVVGIRRRDTIYSDVSFYFEINKELTTAIENVDFRITTSSPMTFETTYLRSKQIKVLVFDNAIRESSKKVVIDITSVTSPGYLASDPRIEITIIDDD